MGVIDFFSVLQYRKFIVLWATLVGLTVGLGAGALLPVRYVSSAKVQVDSLQRNTLTGLVEPRFRVVEFLGQQVAVATSRSVAIDVIDALSAEGVIILSDFENDWRRKTGGETVPGNDLRTWAADELLKGLAVEADAIESTLKIAFRAEDPAQAARIANAFASAYMTAILDQRQRRYARNARSFSDETRALAENVETAQGDLADFRRESGVLPLGPQRVEAAEVELAAITARLAEARADSAEAASLLAQALATPRGQLLSFPLPDDALPGLQAQVRLASVSATLARIAERYGEKYPDYLETLREKQTLESNILQSVRDRADYAARRVAALESQAARLKSDVVSKKNTREAYDLLEKKVVASQNTYDLVTTRSLEEALQSRVDTVDARLLASAAPPANAATPPLAIIVLIGFGAGLALGAMTAIFVELNEGRIRSIDALRAAFKTSILAEVAALQTSGRRPRTAAA